MRGKILLTDTQIKRLRVKDKKYKVADGDGLYLSVEVSGSKRWEYVYNNVKGKRTSKSLGKYPTVGLREAREKRDHLKYGMPATVMTFGDLKEEYLNYHKSEWTDQYFNDSKSLLKRDFDNLMIVPLSDINKDDLISGFQKMRARGLTEAIRKAGSLINRIMVYGVTMSKINTNPMRDINPAFFIKKREVKQYSHITEPKMLKALLCAIKTYEGIDVNTRAAMMFAVHAFVRPSNIRFMLKSEVDFDKREWGIPASKMKLRKDHVVPLTSSMISILKSVWDTHTSEYIFPSPYSNFKPLSENTLNNSLKRLGVCEITAHGLRHTASTFLNEYISEHGLRADVIEMQLAHVDKNTIRGTYNKALYMKERVSLMQWWSDYLDSLQENCEEDQ